jgi:hypothetical protein
VVEGEKQEEQENDDFEQFQKMMIENKRKLNQTRTLFSKK